MVGIEVVGDDSGRSVLAVSRTEGVHHIVIGVIGEGLGKLLLTHLHFFLCLVVSRIFLVDAYGLTLFFGIEAEVFKQKHFAGLQGSGSFLCFGAVGGERHGGVERSGYGFFDLTERELGVHLTFGLTHVAHDDKRAAVGKHLLKGGERTADAGVVGDVTVLVEGHIEVHTYDGFPACEVASIDCHDVVSV